MLGRNSVIMISVVCALAFTALTAANASAEQRAYVCETGGAHQFEDAHCIVPNTTTGFYHHQLLPITATSITATNSRTASGTTAATVEKLKGSLGGVVTEIQCTSLSGTGSLTNAASSVTGTGTLVYSGCTVTKPENKGCVVTGGSVLTTTVKGTTVGQTAGHLKFTPNSGTEFATVPISGCENTALNNNFPVVGSLVANVSGATTTSTHTAVTAQGLLEFGGVEAGLEGALTITTGGLHIPVVLT
jgi:hypothetical protein